MTKENKSLFVLYGASGSGKSSLLNFAKELDGISIHQKDTTRPKRSTEKDCMSDLRFVQKIIRHRYLVTYKKYGYRYGIRKDLIEKAIERSELHFIILTDISAIKKLKHEYPGTVIIYLHADPDKIPLQFKLRNDNGFKKRKEGIRKQYADFIRNNILFNHVIVNFGNIENAQEQLFNIIRIYKPRIRRR